jgi:hypothetical protein
VLTLALSLVGAAEPCPDLPLQSGTGWTYAADISWTDTTSKAVRDTSLAWRTEVLSVRDSGGARVAVVRNWPSALAWWDPTRPPDTTQTLCIGENVYRMDRDSAREPTEDDLLLALPLSTQKLYGRSAKARDDTLYAWYVESAAVVSPGMIRLGAQRGDSAFTVS